MTRALEIVPYDPDWPAAFDAERRRLAEVLGDLAVRIEHDGSTSVPGLAAKPVIDIQIAVKRLQPLDVYASRLESLGYTHRVHPDDAFAPFFHRPGTWPHTHHVHVVEAGGPEERKTLAFRDYLRAHPEAAREYEALKRKLAPGYDPSIPGARQAYADAKGDFIREVTERALAEGHPRGVPRERTTANADRYWAQYLASLPAERRPARSYVEAFSFGFTPEDGREIAPLVLAGTKTATGSVYWSYAFDQKRLPEVGDLCVVTAGSDDPVCVIETTEVRVLPFDEVTPDYARDGGEGDRSMATWRDIYWHYVLSECRRIGREPSPKAPLVMERFRVVYREASR